MTLRELESAVAQLPRQELVEFTKWFEEFLADAWERQMEADILSGKLEGAGKQAEADFDAGNCSPL